jgi:hypothetical protein
LLKPVEFLVPKSQQSVQLRINRRGFLSVGGAGVLALGLPRSLTAASGRAPVNAATGNAPGSGRGRAKSVLLVLLSGGPSQLDTFDMKPAAPAEIRGEFQPIATATPGLHITQHLPQLAQRSGWLSVVRSMSHPEHNHLLATHVVLTGRPTPVARGGSDLDRQQSRDDFPNYAAALDYVRPRDDGLPTGVSLPNYFIEGPLTWPGQHAGFLGVRHDPWQINQDPSAESFRVESVSLPDGLSVGRLAGRRELLDQLAAGDLSGTAGRSFAEQQDLAFSLLTSNRVSQAFEIAQEDAAVRDRYGRHKFGQSLLLARRLVEAGVPMVQAAMGIVQTWDTHVDNWGKLKNTLLPQLDQGLSALLDDLSSRGLLDETLVVVMGEFGRTPRISTLPGQTRPGRDHWAHTYSLLFAGAGVCGGHVIGESDEIAAYPVSRSWSPADLCTTIFDALGVSREAEVHDRTGRPYRLSNGNVIEPIYSGAPA